MAIKLWIRSIFRTVFFSVALLWPAGTVLWWEAWVVIALWTIYGSVMTGFLLRHDPALLKERLKFVPIHEEQKSWDKIIMLMFFIAGISLYLVPGFDVVRFSWSEPLPLWMRVVAMVIHIPCFVLLGWVMRENTYSSQVVKLIKHVGTRSSQPGLTHLFVTPCIPLLLFYSLPCPLHWVQGLHYSLRLF